MLSIDYNFGISFPHRVLAAAKAVAEKFAYGRTVEVHGPWRPEVADGARRPPEGLAAVT